MQETKRKLGRLDGVVNNAGIVGPVESFIDYSIEAFKCSGSILSVDTIRTPRDDDDTSFQLS